MICRAQVSFPTDSSLPRDAMVLTPHYMGVTPGTGPGPLATKLRDNIKANAQIGATTPFTVTIYDAQGPKPHPPLASASNGSGFSTTTLPRDVALCLSFYSGFNRPRLRGRLYIPAWMAGGTLAQRPTLTQRQNVGSLATAFGGAANLPAGVTWVVYSRKDDEGYPINNWWVDDEWDTVRSRGLKASTRTTGTVSP